MKREFMQRMQEFAAEVLGERSIVALDVGARAGHDPQWWFLRRFMRVVGFEPDKEECERLNTASDESEKFYPLAMSYDSGLQVLFNTDDPACSSLRKPIDGLGLRYPDLRRHELVSTSMVEATTIDDWMHKNKSCRPVKFIKIDAQGSDYDVIEGAMTTLEGCVGLEVEVEFSAMYEGAVTFSQIDAVLGSLGFKLWRLKDLCHYGEGLSSRATGGDGAYYGGFRSAWPTGNGRLFWGNAVYFKDYTDFEPSKDTMRDIIVLACLYGAAGDITAAYGAASWVLSHPDACGLTEHATAKLVSVVKDIENHI